MGTNPAPPAGMRPRPALAVVALVLGGCAGTPEAPEKPLRADAQRGRLLYDTTCVQCHTTQAHWREKRLVRSWPDLVHQVTRWQALVGQNWQARDVEDVAAYLNQEFYRLPGS